MERWDELSEQFGGLSEVTKRTERTKTQTLAEQRVTNGGPKHAPDKTRKSSSAEKTDSVRAGTKLTGDIDD
jgi:hypothetical protein